MAGTDTPRCAIAWQQGKLRTDLAGDALQAALRDPAALVWLDIQGDLSAYTSLLTRTFKLAPLTIESLGEERGRAKLTEGKGYFYLIVHGLIFSQQTLEGYTPKLDIAFGRNFVLTAHHDPLPWLTTLWKSAHNRANKSEEHVLSRGTAYLLHAILDALVDSYFPVLDALDEVVDALETETVSTASDSVQGRIFAMKRTLAQMRRVISPQVEVANSLVTHTGALIPTEAEPYFADVHDHLVRAFEVIDSYRDLMSGLLDVYLSTVSNRLNQVMKQLAIIATLFMPITFITGIFGQNFAHQPQVEHDGGLNFWLVLLVMGAITVGQVYWFRRRGWL
jgi:magnesium transporter